MIRNAGGVITDDAIRWLVISQPLLATREIILIHHTDCGMLTFSDDDVKAAITEDVGVRPPFALEAFPEVEQDVRQSLRRVRSTPSSLTPRQYVASSSTWRLASFAR